jgi:hypothetical protein
VQLLLLLPLLPLLLMLLVLLCSSLSPLLQRAQHSSGHTSYVMNISTDSASCRSSYRSRRVLQALPLVLLPVWYSRGEGESKSTRVRAQYCHLLLSFPFVQRGVCVDGARLRSSVAERS